MKQTMFRRSALGLALVIVGCNTAVSDEPTPDNAAAAIAVNIGTDQIDWVTQAPYGSAHLRVVSDDGADRVDRDLPALNLSATGQNLAVGLYHYELVLSPPGPPRTQGAGTRPPPRAGGRTLSGVFSVGEDGRFVIPTLEKDAAPAAKILAPRVGAGAMDVAAEVFGRTDDAHFVIRALAPPSSVPKLAARRVRAGAISPQDVVIAENQEIQGSLCVGLDCVNNESFGFDTVRLKENNTRLTFIDTTVDSGNNRVHDSWELNANDSASGGANYLGIADLGAGANSGAEGIGKQVTIGKAPANALHVGSDGHVGLRTAVPATNLHITTGDTPALRLEQNASGGFTAQTWDVAGNEANFFVRDVTNGSLLPFRIRPGAPESSIDIAGNGNVGLATPRPRAPLHLFRVDGSASATVEETSATAAQRTLTELANNGAVAARLAYSDTADWTARGDTSFSVSPSSGPAALQLDASGNLALLGTLSTGSSRSIKHDIHAAALDHILALVRDLPLYTWQYLTDRADVRHVGPMAEDVHARFHLGDSARALAPADVAGLAAAAAQALNRKLAQKDAELDQLTHRLDALERKLDAGGSAP